MILNDMVEEYMKNSESIIEDLEKEAKAYKEELAAVKKTKTVPFITKEAAAETAAALVGKGLMSPQDLSYKIDRLRADPLGVITQIVKQAAQAAIPLVGGVSDRGGKALTDKGRSKADVALLTRLNLV